MPTYHGSAFAKGEATARYNYRNPDLVTATATATATSTLSQADADSIAQQIAQQTADNQAKQHANVIVHAVNAACLGETVYGLDSSFVDGYIKPTSSTTYELSNSYTVLDNNVLKVGSGQTFIIPSGKKLCTGTKGTLQIEFGGTVIVNGTLEYGVVGTSPLSTQTNSNTDISFLATYFDLSNNNSGTIDISNNGVAIVNPGVTFTNDAAGLIKLNGAIILNYGTFNNVGDIQGFGDFSNNILNGVPRTINGSNYAPKQDVSFNNLGLIGGGNITTNSIGILNGEANQNTFNINFVNSNIQGIVIDGYIVNNTTFTNENGTCFCSGFTNSGKTYNHGTLQTTADNSANFSNYGNTYNYGELITNIFNNVSLGTLDISANFYNYGNLSINNYFVVAQLSDFSSTIYNTISITTPPSYGEITLNNTVPTPVQLYGNILNNTDCSFNCFVNGFENYGNITNGGYMLFGTVSPPTTSLTNGNGAIISNSGEIYCGSFVNDPSGNVIGIILDLSGNKIYPN